MLYNPNSCTLKENKGKKKKKRKKKLHSTYSQIKVLA